MKTNCSFNQSADLRSGVKMTPSQFEPGRRPALRNARIQDAFAPGRANLDFRWRRGLSTIALALFLQPLAFSLQPSAFAATNDLTAALQKGLFEEEANRNLDAAISNYQALAMQFDRDRQIAATAIFRLGECYRKLGQTNDAVIQYERIIREFSDQKTLATLSRQNLTGLESVSKSDAEKSSHLASPESAAAPATTVVTDDEEQEIRRIRAMIQNSPDLINAPVKIGDAQLTPLGHAANNGQLRVAQFLLDSGAEVNRSRDFNSWPPLLIAASSGHKAMVELLLAKGADVNSRDGSGQTALHLAAKNGFQSVAEVLLANKADVNARDKNQDTPLHQASAKGHSAMVAYLLAHQAEPNAQNKSGQTPAILATRAEQSETLNKLLAAGAKPDIEDSDGRTPLSYAADNGHLDTVKALLAAKADQNAGRGVLPLHLAVHGKNPAIMELLLDAGADANRVSPINWQFHLGNNFYGQNQANHVSPFFVAIGERNADAVKLLLQHKADPNGTDPDGLPVILSAMNQPEIVKALLEAGANPNVDDGNGRYPLIMARDLETVRTLLAHKANLEIRCNGMTPLLEAATWPPGSMTNEIAETLLKGGANANATNGNGATALYFAVANGNQKLVELLLTHKADVNARDNAGKTPLDYAKPQAPPGTMTLPLSYQWSSGSQGQTPPAPSNSLAALLRQHGALDDLPKLDRIEVGRPSENISDPVFRKGTNNWNQFTLLELIGQQYGFVSQDADPARGVTTFGDAEWDRAEFRFPEFRKVTIQRVMTGGPQRKTIEVDLESLLASGDCNRDVVLQWGDRVEIPEADHPVDQHWAGLNTNQIITLAKCVSRNVTLIIKGVTNTVAVGPYYRPYQPGVDMPLVPGVEFPKTLTDDTNNSRRLPRRMLQLFPMQQAAGHFKLTAVLRGSGMLRASSDLSRVKVTRRDPATGKKLEWTLDCSGDHTPDLWLRDGDVIEVPEK